MTMESAAVDDQSQGPTILAACWVLFAIPALMAGLRFWCKAKLSRGLGLDDLLLGIALAVNMGVVGRHVFAIEDQEKIPPALKLVYISYVIIIIGCVFSKTSFAFTLLRIVTRTWMKILIWIIIISMNAIMWLCAICYLAQCKPAEALWNVKLMATAKCWPSHVFETIALTAGAYSGCMDFVLSVLPFVVLWELEMKKREKAGIALAMSMGIFAAATAFINTSKLVNVSQVQDFTWFCSTITSWASVETGLTIFAASIPALRLLFIRMRSGYDNPSDPSSNYSGKSYNQRGTHGTDTIALEDNDAESLKSMLSKTAVKTERQVAVTSERDANAERELESQRNA
ncbi:hypothetical protein N7532_000584 [Penicillium argentinense]|uniref:Rhodopsin domain-containing protein n=1 Tax=Penicillium argentinense TaxID=1131581 RepID=A0A9W9G5I2_9EURO|nr:uncharacterized protein N7532_000584 [Penicillium argentinense]KAJ5112539.1 hypothetical protein N7532_000584 [Penicillium argentinense]